MSTNVETQNRHEAPITSPLICGERRRPPLGVDASATSHGALRDRLLGCAG